MQMMLFFMWLKWRSESLELKCFINLTFNTPGILFKPTLTRGEHFRKGLPANSATYIMINWTHVQQVTKIFVVINDMRMSWLWSIQGEVHYRTDSSDSCAVLCLSQIIPVTGKRRGNFSLNARYSRRQKEDVRCLHLRSEGLNAAPQKSGRGGKEGRR